MIFSSFNMVVDTVGLGSQMVWKRIRIFRHLLLSYFNRIKFREIKICEPENSRIFLDLMSRVSGLKDFAWI